MNANAALQAHESLAEQERQEAAELAPEIVRDLEREHQEANADKLPAELASISEMFSAMVERKAEIARKAAEDIAAVDAQMLRTLNQVLRRLAVEIDLRQRDRNTLGALRKMVEKRAAITQTQVACIYAATDQAAASMHETDEHERLYREQYEHAPEPPDDDGGSRAPVTRQSGMDRDLERAVDDLMESELAHVVASLRGGGHEAPSLRTRGLNAVRAMLNPEQFIRRNASPPYAA